MSRKHTLTRMRVAGYHKDTASFTRLVIEGRIARPAANDAWRAGVTAKTIGVKCNCFECNKQTVKP